MDRRHKLFLHVIQYIVLLSFPPRALSGHHHCGEVEECSVQEDCPPWFASTDQSRNCSCIGNKHKDVINRDKMCNLSSVYSSCVLLEFGYCMTYNNSTTHLIPCPYDTAVGHPDQIMGQTLRLKTTTGNLTNFTCDQLNRKGKHCAECIEGFGQSIFTFNLNCYDCSRKFYHGWFLYLFFELVPLTIFIILILLLQLSPTDPSLKSFVLFSQIITVYLSLGYEPPYKHMFGPNTHYFLSMVKTGYGFWNLDFFRSVVPPFCVGEGMNNFEVLAFHYISVIYPTLLTVLAWVIVELHERGFKPVVKLWKPFRRYLSHYSVTNEPKRIIVSFLATVVLLNYTKVMFLSANLVNTVQEHTLCEREGDGQRVLFLQPDMKYFQADHVPIIFLAFTMFVIFVVLPLLILILYPLKWIQDKLKSFCVGQNNIQMFAEAMCGCYLDGTNDKPDRRLFSTIYLFLRIFLVLLFVKGSNFSSIAVYMVSAAVHGFVVGLLFYRKPYKKEAYIYLDILFFSTTGAALLFAAVATHNTKNEQTTKLIFAVIFAALLMPLLYACIRILVILVKWLKLINIRSIVQRRRRGYQEITEYGDDPETSISEADQNRYEQARRTREGDSFQTE